MQILHVIDRLTAGGPTRSMLALAKLQRRAGLPHIHRAVVLQTPIYPVARMLAAQAGVELLLEPDSEALREAITKAEIVQLHFWNNPLFYEFLRTPLPAMRLLLWMHIVGNSAPQIITPQLTAFADQCVVTTPASLMIDALQSHTVPNIYGIADFDRLGDARLEPHEGFNVTYIGTLNFAKLHPEFIPMSAAVNIPQARFIVCGENPEHLLHHTEALGAAGRFEFRGFVEGIRPVLAVSDVFGYPLCADTYASSDTSLQEAMWMGVPPVVFPYGGLTHLVQNGVSGLVVDDTDAYRAAIEALYDQPDMRRRLSQGAMDFARTHFDGAIAAVQFNDVYQQMMETPKHERLWPASDDPMPSGRFIESLGTTADCFVRSKTAVDAAVLCAADAKIANATPLLAHGEGGIMHYRNTYPDDAYLRYWSALVLLRQGRRAEAQSELDAAQALGIIDAAGRALNVEGLLLC